MATGQIILGDDNNNSLTGTADDDTIDGAAGNDTLSGGFGNDSLIGGAGNDTLNGGDGIDTASYTSATAGVTVNLGYQGTIQDTFGAGIDTLTNFENLTGSAYADRLTGTSTNNVIEGGAGNDTLDGEAGADTASYASATAGVTVSLDLTSAQNTGGAGTDTLTAFENLIGSQYDDSLTGSGGGNVIAGGAGNDTLDGSRGNDTLDGGTGIDTASYASYYDGYASYFNYAGVTVSLAQQGSAQNTGGVGTDTLTNFENLIGSQYNDSLTGSSGDNVIEGGDRNDTLDGGTGTDTASYASAASAVTVSLALATAQNTGGAGTDILTNFENLIGSAYGDSLTGSSGDNALTGGGGNDALNGGDGNDTLEGGTGNDTLDGGDGVDFVSYDSATSAVTVSLALTSAQNTGGAGTDILTNIEVLIGSAYSDSLTGSSGANALIGGDGDDTLRGGAGDDELSADAGNDAVVWAAGDGDDYVLLGTGTNTIDFGPNAYTYVDDISGQRVFTIGSDTVTVVDWTTGNNSVVSYNQAPSITSGGSASFAENGTGTAYTATGTDPHSNPLTYALGGLDAALFNINTTSGAVTFKAAPNFEAPADAGANNVYDITVTASDGSLSSAAQAVAITVTDAVEFKISQGDGSATDINAQPYTGPVAGIDYEVIAGGSNDIIIGSALADFINSGAGDDAIDGGVGNDVIDGGLGSNFISGGAGVDTFFLDGRAAATSVTWSTITDFQAGDQLTMWGYQPGVSIFLWVGSDGAEGYKGATLHGDLDGNGVIDSSVTFTGLTQAQLPTPSYGTVGGQDYIFFG